MNDAQKKDLHGRGSRGNPIQQEANEHRPGDMIADAVSDAGTADSLLEAIATRLNGVSARRLDDLVGWCLGSFCEHVDADRVLVLEICDGPVHGTVLHRHDQLNRKAQTPLATGLPWVMAELSSGRSHSFQSRAEFPVDAQLPSALLDECGIEACLAAALGHRGTSAFALVCESSMERVEWTPDVLMKARLAGTIIIGAIERCRSETALLELKDRVLTAEEQERRKIARELHDDTKQRLAHICLDLTKLNERIPAGDPVSSELLEGLLEQSGELFLNIGNICRDLYPSKLDYLGLLDALHGLCREFSLRYKIDLRFRGAPDSKAVDGKTGLSVYRIVQEALHNVAKHSQASSAKVTFESSLSGIELSVSDNGVGFDVYGESARAGLGLRSIQDRLELLDGRLWIESSLSSGTRLDIWIPTETKTQMAQGLFDIWETLKSDENNPNPATWADIHQKYGDR